VVCQEATDASDGNGRRSQQTRKWGGVRRHEKGQPSVAFYREFEVRGGGNMLQLRGAEETAMASAPGIAFWAHGGMEQRDA